MKQIIYFLLFWASFSFVFAQESGIATYYGSAWQGRRTASGEPYNTQRYTAAHKTYPFGTLLKVTHLDKKKAVVVRVIDRGPFGKGRIIDLADIAAGELGILRAGIADVQVEIYDPKKTYSDLETKRLGIQIAMNSNTEQLAPAISKLFDLKYEDPSIRYKSENGVESYQLYIGPFSTNAEADVVKMKLEKYFPNTSIFDMDNM